ncbi:four helix bundle protein [Reichenbachiella ulvae]|uniref:Four helix bundle protein n=1 Tax=Reichenbachiella ulvae TaxID=2980104 RepID=A0ABT3CRY9_9BACT|nr:four helix bundle protein [Reichenbachiella ulvae]MCV9386318.1 four helix bundle protein [Reichenbachiella ulvae]
MPTIKQFEDLDVWKESRKLVRSIYSFLNQSKDIDRDTKSQMKRCTLSIMNNIAEGFGRNGDKEFVRFLNIASGSASECKSMLYVLEDLEYIEVETAKAYRTDIDKIRKLIHGLVRYLNNKS